METRSNYIMVGAVTVALLAGTLLFIVWLAGLSNKATKCYDIYFSQAVGGLNKGSNVTFSGVPAKTHVPTRSLASLLASAASLDGLSSARTGSPLPVGSTSANAAKTPAIRLTRCVVGLFIFVAPVSGLLE